MELHRPRSGDQLGFQRKPLDLADLSRTSFGENVHSEPAAERTSKFEMADLEQRSRDALGVRVTGKTGRQLARQSQKVFRHIL